MGFFGITQKPKPTAPRATAAGGGVGRAKNMPIRVLGRTAYKGGCAQCPLDKEAKRLRHPKMAPTGSDQPLLYVLGEAPGQNEDIEGEQFVGRSGDLIRDYLPLSLAKRTRWSNTVQCRPEDNRTPTEVEIACCSQRVERDIAETKPLIVAGFGTVPLSWALGQTRIADWRGDLVPIRVGGWTCWYAPLWHPAFMLRKKNDKKEGESYFHTYRRDLDRVFALAQSEDLPEPWVPGGEGDEEALDAGLHWELSWDVGEVASFLEHLREFAPDAQSVDIETNGLRPYRKDSKILSIAFGTWDLSYAIPLQHSQAKWTPKQLKEVWALIREHLRTTSIEFWAHHLKFETEWLSTPFALGRDILFEVNWQDTMAQAYVLTGKSLSGLSLDARSVALFGINEKALDGLDRANLDAAPLRSVLKYNARDTKFTDLVRRLQVPKIEAEGLQEAYRLMVSRVPALTVAQQQGVVPDVEFAEAKHAELQLEMLKIEERIQALPDVVALARQQRAAFNSASGPQLTTLLRDRLQLKEGWRTDGSGKKKYSTDEDVLSQIEHPIGKLILDKRSLAKLDGTYVQGMCKKGKLIWDDGLVHTVYNYLLTTTGRLSSEDPNLQNFPKRTNKEIRRLIRALLGHLFVSIDYGQIEARVIAMASRCPVLCKALWENYDIHMAWTEIIGKAHPALMAKYIREAGKDEKKAKKLFRSDVKNQWTFPLFYGSTLGNVSHLLGVESGKLKKQYDQFWEMFEAVKKWQDKTIANYKRTGYVETLTGRRRYEPLTTNEIINSSSQGTASDIVVDAMRRLAEEAYEQQRWHIAPRMNIHDDLSFYLPEESLEEDLDIIIPIMCTPEFDFVNVPITVEIAVGPNWGDLEDLATVESTTYGYPLQA